MIINPKDFRFSINQRATLIRALKSDLRHEASRLDQLSKEASLEDCKCCIAESCDMIINLTDDAFKPSARAFVTKYVKLALS